MTKKISIHNAFKDFFISKLSNSRELLIPLLVGLGLDEFSMNPNKILNSRKIVNNLDKKECEKLAEEILKLGTTSEVEEKLKEFNKKVV